MKFPEMGCHRLAGPCQGISFPLRAPLSSLPARIGLHERSCDAPVSRLVKCVWMVLQVFHDHPSHLPGSYFRWEADCLTNCGSRGNAVRKADYIGKARPRFKVIGSGPIALCDLRDSDAFFEQAFGCSYILSLRQGSGRKSAQKHKQPRFRHRYPHKSILSPLRLARAPIGLRFDRVVGLTMASP